jgi:prepilin-type N-terminal cleavage/methylation domain-containing protein
MKIRIFNDERALTLIELMLVLAIIAILAALLVPAILKAHRHAQTTVYKLTLFQEYDATKERFQAFISTHTASHVWTVEDLSHGGVFDSYILHWIDAGRIQYFPFTTNDADNKIVMDFWQDDHNSRRDLPVGSETHLDMLKKQISKPDEPK